MKMNFIKRFFAAIIALIMMLALTACDNVISFSNKNKKIKEQFHEVESGDMIAEIVLEGYGSLYAYLFEGCEVTENFIELAKKGYYDGKSIDRIIDNYMIQIDYTNDTGVALSEEEDEGTGLYPYRGALCASDSGKSFFVVQADSESVKQLKELVEFSGYEVEGYLKAAYDVDITTEEFEKYIEYGGAPWLHGNYEVFGQLCAGTDILDKIAGLATNDDNAPVEEIVVTEIKIYEHED